MASKKDQLRKLIDKWQKVCLVEDYTVLETISKKKSSTHDAANMAVDPTYKRAFLVVYPVAWTEQEGLSKVILHEICHIVTDPLHCVILEPEKFTQEQKYEAIERVTEHVANIINKLVS